MGVQPVRLRFTELSYVCKFKRRPAWGSLRCFYKDGIGCCSKEECPLLIRGD